MRYAENWTLEANKVIMGSNSNRMTRDKFVHVVRVRAPGDVQIAWNTKERWKEF